MVLAFLALAAPVAAFAENDASTATDSTAVRETLLECCRKLESSVIGRQIRVDMLIGEELYRTMECKVNRANTIAEEIITTRPRGDDSVSGRSRCYISVPLGIELLSSQEAYSDSKTSPTAHAVFFGSFTTATDFCTERGRHSFLAEVSHTKFILESEVSALTPTGDQRGILCKHPNTWSFEYWINSSGQLCRTFIELKAGLNDSYGNPIPAGMWSKSETVFTWISSDHEQLEKIQHHSESSSGTSDATHYIREFEDLDEELTELIPASEEFGLANGTSVNCYEQPGRYFEYQDGRVVAGVDLAAVNIAQAARFNASNSNRSLYYAGLSLALAMVVGVLLWKRR